ncbi:MAG TPA: hypothetical protein VLK22_02380 [Candidatus Udaeobacter sp.]|nr:hypothetical protein [Candidatus Udaeobacter sp.]
MPEDKIGKINQQLLDQPLIFLIRQIYRLLFIWPFQAVVSVISYFKFYNLKISNQTPQNFCFIVTSVIYIKQRDLNYTSKSSVYTPEERAAQTIKTIESIRAKAPGAKIILLEVGLQKNLPLDLENKVDQYVYLGDKFLVRKASDSKFKSLSEAVMLLHAKKYIKSDADVFIKICGRYVLDENFNLDSWRNNLFRLFYIRPDYVSTRLYSLGKQMLPIWYFVLIKGLPLLLLGYPIEHILARYIPKKYIVQAEKIGLMGADATSGQAVKE